MIESNTIYVNRICLHLVLYSSFEQTVTEWQRFAMNMPSVSAVLYEHMHNPWRRGKGSRERRMSHLNFSLSEKNLLENFGHKIPNLGL